MPSISIASNGDCGQPSSIGSGPSVSDALTILRDSVGEDGDCDLTFCICDVDCSGNVSVGDALRTLIRSVGTDIELDCCCELSALACTSASFELRPGSEIDYGWTGIAHNEDLGTALPTTMRVLRRCAGSGEPCEHDDDCSSQSCVVTCNCSTDTSCEITGPTSPRRCVNTMVECETNADCPSSVACLHPAGPPLPLSSGGTPVCLVNFLDAPFTGTANTSDGSASVSVSLTTRVLLGITIDKPCPRCGAPDENPRIGDQFTCSGGQFNAAPCTVHGLSESFGGTSFDCPPQPSSLFSPMAIRFTPITTAATARSAELPCSDSAFRNNPGLPLNKCLGFSSAGADCSTNVDCTGGGVCNVPRCLDSGEPCSSNADCRRCSGDTSIACSRSVSCEGNGKCAEAPEQPVTCGFWCSSGFCNGNAGRPCLETADCPIGETCQVGPGVGSQPNVPQRRPNDCAQDNYVCGQDQTERCAITPAGVCSDQPYRSCTQGSTTCETANAGVCVITARPCFEARITRRGDASPLGDYCASENKACDSNADCTSVVGDFCEHDASRPKLAALFSSPGTANPGINNVAGIPGPGAIRLNGFVKVCYCGDGTIGCDEQCDDANTAGNDGCDDLCQNEPSAGPTVRTLP